MPIYMIQYIPYYYRNNKREYCSHKKSYRHEWVDVSQLQPNNKLQTYR
jgi:hypothetical protein